MCSTNAATPQARALLALALLGCSNAAGLDRRPPRALRVPSEFATIQAAIDAALDDDWVVVEPGTYHESGIRFHSKPITVRGTAPEDSSTVARTVVDAKGQDVVFRFEAGESRASALQGLTITGGRAAEEGGGLRCVLSQPTISHCAIVGNETISSTLGGGIYCAGPYDSGPLFEDCRIEGNAADWIGGGIYTDGSAAQFRRCIIRRNEAPFRGGIVISGSNPRFDACWIEDNRANAIFVGSSTPVFTNCFVVGHRAGSGAVLELGWAAYPWFINCTIVDNTSICDLLGFSEYSIVNVRDSIIREEICTEIVVNYSNLWEQGLGGEGNIHLNPQLRSLWGYRYALSHASPCIDAGTPARDDGHPWPPGYGNDPDRVDMGAYGGPGAVDWALINTP